MAERADDELDALRALYARLTPPELPDELERADTETAQAVGWVRAAWRTLEVPPARVPLRALPRRRARTLALALTAAAIVLAVLGSALRAVHVRRIEPERVAQAPAVRPAITVNALPDRLELVSGPVRLVLLDPPRPKSAQ